MNELYTIYKYTNSISGKVYVGQTSLTMEQRAQSNGHNYIQCPRFYNAIKTYGWSKFVPEIICQVETQEEANSMEEYWISYYHSTDPNFGYNLSNGGHSPLSEEACKKISEKAKERYKDKTKNPMYGRKHSDESKKKMRDVKLGEKNPMYGRKWTEKQRQNCGTKGKKLNLSEDQREFLREKARKIGKETGLKPVKCIEDGKVFRSMTDAAGTYGVAISTLSGHLNGRQNSCAGKHFVFV